MTERNLTNLVVSGESGDKYTFLSRIDEGGFGEVWQGKSTKGTELALKILLPKHSGNSQEVKRFLSEGLALNRLDHPHILKAYDYGFCEKEPFIVMELMEHNLYSHLEKSKTKKINSPQALEIIINVAEALKEAHHQNIIHCDIHPGNILFDHYGKVKLSDFGVAKIARESPLHEELRRIFIQHGLSYSTMVDDINQLGRPSNRIATKEIRDKYKGKVFSNLTYASPEVLFKGAAAADYRSDIYSLALVSDDLFAGYGTESMRAAIRKSLIVKPELRHQSITELINDLKSVPNYAQVIGSYLGRDLLPAEEIGQLEELLRTAAAEEPESLPAWKGLLKRIEQEQRNIYDRLVDKHSQEMLRPGPARSARWPQARKQVNEILSAVRAFKKIKV